MADSSTTSEPILNPSLGRHLARRQLHAGIKGVAIVSIPMKSVSTLGGVLGRLRGEAGDPRTRWQIPLQPLGQF